MLGNTFGLWLKIHKSVSTKRKIETAHYKVRLHLPIKLNTPVLVLNLLSETEGKIALFWPTVTKLNSISYITNAADHQVLFTTRLKFNFIIIMINISVFFLVSAKFLLQFFR